jgi:hypothetical protein
MLSRRDDPFPFEAARDLLGLMRSLYAARRRAGAAATELEGLARAGKELQEALALAATSKPGTVGHAAAWKRAEDATQIAGSIDAIEIPAEPVLREAVGRVVRRSR